MRFLSLFAGIGGFDLGLERAGWTCAGQVEIDPFCQRILAKHWPHVKRMEDVRNVKGDEFGAVEAIVGGFPCQPHSVAGKRQGKKDPRHLWEPYLRIIRRAKPAWVVPENVTGLRSSEADSIIRDLVREGYTCWPIVVGAGHAGAPHLRRRVFLVAHLDAAGRSNAQRRQRSRAAARNAIARTLDRGSIRLGRWSREPAVGRVVHGLSCRLDRVRIERLGNAVVPEVAEVIGRAILEAAA